MTCLPCNTVLHNSCAVLHRMLLYVIKLFSPFYKKFSIRIFFIRNYFSSRRSLNPIHVSGNNQKVHRLPYTLHQDSMKWPPNCWYCDQPWIVHGGAGISVISWTVDACWVSFYPFMLSWCSGMTSALRSDGRGFKSRWGWYVFMESVLLLILYNLPKLPLIRGPIAVFHVTSQVMTNKLWLI